MKNCVLLCDETFLFWTLASYIPPITIIGYSNLFLIISEHVHTTLDNRMQRTTELLL